MTEQNPRGADLEEFERVDDVTPAQPDDRSGSDKDLLHGGSGEDGPSTHPVTDDDLLNGGSGWPQPDRQDQDVERRRFGRVRSA